jgi:hypothetical protein
MNQEIAKYIRNFFPNLMTDEERLALKHLIYTDKVDNSTSDSSIMRKLLIERGLISSNPKILDLLSNGSEEFELRVAKRIMTETPDKVFFNKCPKCSSLARTPYARQCRFCRYSWHDLTIAQFKLVSSFQLTGGYFFLLGNITKGQVSKGSFLDLTMLGLNKKPKIEAIEFALKKQDGKVWEDIALGTNDLSEEDKDYLKQKGAFGTPFDILKER